ncbi:MAG: sigma-54 dependent transcriptional regulator [Acidobacteriia bacterium]|nr:sigma-54 dependent transcriptional regulator [Terriglobia bacterium]
MAFAETQAVNRNSRVLIASSNEDFRRQWAGNPEYGAVDVEEAAGGADALAKLESANWGEVLLDRRLHDLDVNEVLHIIRARHPHLLVRLVDSDVSALAAGDLVEVPNDSILSGSAGICEGGVQVAPEDAADPAAEEEASAQTRASRIEPLPGMMGDGPGLEQTYRLARLVAPRQTTVLITGETGTGKELVARGIHQISSRAKSAFVVVNCAAIPEQLLEAELFGHARGAFTGAVQSRLGRIHLAQGGTLFLDEIGELPLGMQAKLLRFLQDGEVQRLGSPDVFRVDVRVISATNINLQRSVQEKKFRQDLYYRLAVFPLELPPLRERKEDIVPLAEHFLDMLSEQSGVSTKVLSPSASAALCQYGWPGNVRELQHAVERAFILCGEDGQLRAAHFSFSDGSAPVREI